ncbi:MAG: Peptidase M23 family protein [Candidatus Gottesmanbacteria bacterium GW2011_GWA1_47_8]|uniref:Peptidase M23 family protein n=1 Tax=Candidatus Gottesmanbacteria bacterium GW2011_GWA1_47_8 TaxID=1618438 RepID=A0A0G1TG50_9BACT|nr:MAG: Peptidase M23 family protein [Candidatus Gottesmanbacteria bacterium GW2011_GWA1_47_8]
MLRILGLGRIRSKTITSNPLSLRLRPIFEHKSAKNILGLPLLGLTMISGALNSPLLTAMGVVPANIEAFYQPYQDLTSQIETKPAIAYPVKNALGISQGFNVFHPGVDIRAPRGSEINPIAGGIVEAVLYDKYGYGTHVLIDHQDSYDSLYAHMDRAFVTAGQKVTTDTVLGVVGMTGHTTGPHLHLEVYRDGRAINPVTFLSR